MNLRRYGRKIPLPSTRELKHDMRMMAAAEALSRAATGADVKSVIDELARANELSEDQARALLVRFAIVAEPGTAQPGAAAHPTDIAQGAIEKMDQDIEKDRDRSV